MKKYTVPIIPQTKPMGCWAASIAMILAWREQICHHTAESVARACGYTKQREAGLAPDDTAPLKHWGFEWLAPQSITVSGFYQLLCQYGPLWVATKSPFPPPSGPPVPHVRVVTGMEPHPDASKTVLYVNDPAPRGRGSSYQEGYLRFVGKKDTLGLEEMGIGFPIYTAHLVN